MPMKIDLDSMSERQQELNRKKSQLMAFQIGDRVAFEVAHVALEGMVTRINHKTATVNPDDGRAWLVSPGLLTKVAGKNEN
jgi:ribosomal protein L21E